MRSCAIVPPGADLAYNLQRERASSRVVNALPRYSPPDRLGYAAFGAVLTHMVVILGVSFSMPQPTSDRVAPLEVTLVQTRTDKTPFDPQFLAQANQDGGGNADASEIARSPLPVSELSERNDDLPLAHRPPQQQVISMREVNAYVVQPEALQKIRLARVDPAPRETEVEPENLGLLEDIREERARLSAEISRAWQEYQKRPQRKFLNARTQEYKYAVYVDAWRSKVERVGNLNYPEDARRLALSGNLMLDVAIRADGSVEAVSVRRSSGVRLLDDAAVRIVELAAPFERFPREIRQEADILHITRTWRFNQNSLYTELP